MAAGWEKERELAFTASLEFKYRKIPKKGLYFSKALLEGLIFGGACILRGLFTEGNLRF